MRDRVLLAALSAVVALGLAELALAVAAPQIYRLPDVWTHDPGLGWCHRADSQGQLVTPEFSVTYRIDAAGRRQHPPVEADGVAARTPGATAAHPWRLQLFGDSFAEGWGVEVEDGLAARLEAHLHAAGTAARVENYGVAGYGTDQELLLFAERDAGAPDVVVCLFYANDLWNNISRHGIGVRRGAKPFFRPGIGGRLVLRGVPVPPPPPRQLGWSQRLATHLHLWALLTKVTHHEAEVPDGPLERYYGGLYTPVDRDAEFRPLWDLTEALLATFAERVQRGGGRFVLAYAPAIVQIEADDWRAKRELHGLAGDYDLGKPSRLLRAIAARHDIELVDLYPTFLAAARQGADLYYPESHWRAAGHELAARTLAAYLERQTGTAAGPAAGTRGPVGSTGVVDDD